MILLYKETSKVLERAFHRLEGFVDKPEFVRQGSYQVFRYKNASLQAAVLQKAARTISGLNASLVLIEKGFVQEMGVLCRTLDEFFEDTLFLCQAIETGEVTEAHRRFLESFYQEEFDQPDNPLLSSQNRPTMPRRKIQASNATLLNGIVNPSDGQEVFRTISQAFSGYVHGASCHILEMYGGNPPSYHLTGLLGTPRIEEWMTNAWNYFYRGLLSLMRIAQVFNQPDVLAELFEFRDHFETVSGKTQWEDPEKLARKIKKK